MVKIYMRVPDRKMTIPKGYRVAWREFNRRSSICFPIGLHLVARWCNLVWRWSYAYRGDRWEQALEDVRIGDANRAGGPNGPTKIG
jgi:hypothetical protein